MFKLTFRSLITHKRRFAGTFLAILLGVSFLTGTLVLGDTLTANFDRLFADANAGTDVVVRSANEVPAEDLQSGRGLLPATIVDRIEGVDGVAAAVASIEGYGQLISRDGKAVGGNGPPTLAGNWVDDPDLNPYRLTEGRPPQARDEVVVNVGAAEKAGVGVADTVTVRTPDPVTATVVGLATFGDSDGIGAVTFVAFTLDDAQRYLTPGGDQISTAPVGGQISAVLVKARDGVSQETLAASVRSVLPDQVEAITGEELTAENVDSLSADFLSFFKTVLLVFSGVALLVATFSIYNTFSIIVAQRTRESALLRALGASRRQVLSSTLAETATVGIVASLIGAGGGLVIAGLLKGLFDAFGFSLPAGGLTVKPSGVIAAVLIGVVATLASGLVPALKAAGTAPLAALRDMAVDRTGASVARAITGVVVAGLGVALVVVALLGGGANALAPAGLGALVTLIGIVIVGPVVAGPASGAIGSPLIRLRGITGVLARRNAMRNPRRTSGTAASLMIGVSVVTLFTVFAASLRASVDDRVTNAVTADLVISGGAFGGGGLSPRLATDVEALPEIDGAVGLGTGAALVDGNGAQFSIADTGALAALLDLEVKAGDVADLGPTEIAVARRIADDRHWTVGTEVPVTFVDGTTTPFTIGAVYERADVGGTYLMSRAAWQPHAVQDIDTLVLMHFAPGVTPAGGRAAVERVAAQYGSPQVLTGPEFVEETTSFVSTALGIVYVMLALAILIALMGIANTLSLSVHERTRELGLLRAVGETRSQVRSMVRWESVIIATFGTVGGLGLGVFLAWALVQAASRGDVINTFAAPAGPLAVVLIVGAVAGVVAAIRPARRAARMDVLGAIAS
ncbi:MAG: ABC transporter permease [Acidimicrobiales bacterium]